jgi:CDP-4-dehydro-6-deoxyglucose reductase/ferredoxin-NAD(P)+ reductase (naphthalene dioxygenase ferredoxin-specific)
VSFAVQVEQFDAPIAVEMGQTILDAALAQGFPYPHGCRAGNCTACKSTVLDGEIDLLPYSQFALSDAERASGKILACRAVPWSDCRIAYLEDEELVVHPQRLLGCSIARVERATRDVVVLTLDVESGGPFAFTAGQYASLEFPGLPARDFSMANVPGAAQLEFHIRCVPGGVVSGHVAERARAGEPVRVRGPFGNAYLREGHAGPLILAGGGTGLAPVLSILRAALARDPAREIAVYVGARDEPDLYATEVLDALARAHPSVRVERILSQPAGATARRTGFLCDAIAADFPSFDGHKVYLAGPPVMIDTTVAALEGNGLTKRDIHADAFFAAVSV